MIIYDKIIQWSDRKKISIMGLKNKYMVTDFEDKMPGKEAKLRVHYNTVPHVGILWDSQRGEVDVKIPEIGHKYTSSK